MKKQTKIKTYVLIVSREFPKYHPKAGQETDFEDKIFKGLMEWDFDFQGIAENVPDYIVLRKDYDTIMPKIHTIRGNYELWEKRLKEVQEGKAVISLRYWADRPYFKDENGIGQIEFMQLDKDSGCGVQKLEHKKIDSSHFPNGFIGYIENGQRGYYLFTTNFYIARNDGLTVEDFNAWFASYDLSKPMAIIHFTKFRY